MISNILRLDVVVPHLHKILKWGFLRSNIVLDLYPDVKCVTISGDSILDGFAKVPTINIYNAGFKLIKGYFVDLLSVNVNHEVAFGFLNACYRCIVENQSSQGENSSLRCVLKRWGNNASCQELVAFFDLIFKIDRVASNPEHHRESCELDLKRDTSTFGDWSLSIV